MSFKVCPGSSSFMQPTPEVIKCPDCGEDVEIWSDEATGECPSCSKTVIRTASQSCVDWCKFAKECLGDEKYKKYGEMKAALRKNALITAMQDYFKGDIKRINHAKKVATYAETILAEETSADPNIVLASAVLHDIGIKNSEEKHGSSAVEHQEIEGPPVAKTILDKLEYPEGFINIVCDIIGHHHHPGDNESIEFKVLYDADFIANTERKILRSTTCPSKEYLNQLLTDGGKKVATEMSRSTEST